MTTDPAALAADAIADEWNLPKGTRNIIQEIIEEQYAPSADAVDGIVTAALAWGDIPIGGYTGDALDELQRAVDAYRAVHPAHSTPVQELGDRSE